MLIYGVGLLNFVLYVWFESVGFGEFGGVVFVSFELKVVKCVEDVVCGSGGYDVFVF